jgi:hypothetical protein
MAVRFLVPEHGIRELKDSMSREILALLETAHIEVSSSTQETVVLSPVHLTGEVAIQQGPLVRPPRE